MNEDRFVYVESDPPLKGEERRKDRCRQRMNWLYHNNAVYRAAMKMRSKLGQMERIASGESAEYQRRRKAEKRARMLAVAREYGATLAVVLGLMVGGAARAEEPAVPKCPTLPDVSHILRDKYAESPVATWIEQSGGTMTLFSSADGRTVTVVISRGECAAIVSEGALLRTWAIVGGGEA